MGEPVEREKMYTTEELMKMFRVSRYTLARAIKNGSLKAVKIGHTNHFPESAVKAFMEQSNNKYSL